MKTKQSKEQCIINWLLLGGTLSKLEALDIFSHNNLADVVHKMNKNKPGLIDKMWGTGRDKSRFAIYGLSAVIKRKVSLINKSK